MSQQLGTALHFNHAPGDCPRKVVTVKMFQVEDAQHFEVEKEESFSTSGKQIKQAMVPNRADTFQIQTKHFNENSSSIPSDVKAMATGYSVETNVQTPVPDLCQNNLIQNPVSDTKINELQTKVLHLQQRQIYWCQTGVRKSKSPCLPVLLNSATAYATIDEGSEINCIDYQFAVRNQISFIPTKCTALAAGSNEMKLAGESKQLISVTVKNTLIPIVLTLEKVIVVRNLGVDILIG